MEREKENACDGKKRERERAGAGAWREEDGNKTRVGLCIEIWVF